MNQILKVREENSNLKKFFKIQFITSIFLIIVVLIYFILNLSSKKNENKLSKTVSLNAKLNSVFAGNTEDLYLGRIKIEKINLDYFVYNTYSEENLKVLPCKFSGGNLHQSGNICIIGHNYYDDRFFSNLNKLKIDDVIIMEDLEENKYKYTIYDIYEISESNTKEVTRNDDNYKTLTLCTCTFDRNSRLIIKAKIKI